MKTTCLINSYNYARFIGEAIEGALSQTHPFDEVIVVDDGSTDGSPEMLNAQYGGRANVTIIAKENQGQLSCFNEGYARATGDILFFLDADDVYEPDYVESALQVYRRESDCDFLFTGRRLFGKEERDDLPYQEDRDLGYSVILTLFKQEWIGAATSCLSMRRHVLEEILPLPFVNDWRSRADDCLVFGASLAGARKRYLARPLVRYRVHGENAFHGRKDRDRGAAYRRRLALNRLFEHFERRLSYKSPQLANFPHREFETIDRPTLGNLLAYANISLGAPVSILRRLACIAEMSRHYLKASLRGAPPQVEEFLDMIEEPDVLSFSQMRETRQSQDKDRAAQQATPLRRAA